MLIAHRRMSAGRLAWLLGTSLLLAGSIAATQPLRASADLSSQDNQPIGFTGYVKDPESGLYYAGARYYDPTIGRFTTEDPERGSPMNPPSLHRYLYAYANPATYTDSTGRQVDVEDPSRAAWVLGWNDEQYRDAVAVDTAAREASGGAFLGAGKQVVESAYGVAKWGAHVLAKATFDVGDGKDIVGPIVDGVAGIADAIRKGPNGFVEYEARKSAQFEELIRQGRTIKAGELYGPEVASAMGGVATVGARARAFMPIVREEAIEGIVAEAGSGSVTLRPATPVGVATPDATIGPKIGRSGYESWTEFNAEAYRRYQQYTGEAYDAALAAERDGLLRGNSSTRVGDFVDRRSRARMAAWLEHEGIPEGPGELVKLNRWLRDPAGTGEYVRPDVQLPGSIMDATIGRKSPDSRQLIRNDIYSGGEPTTIVRPSQLGGSCTVIPCRGER